MQWLFEADMLDPRGVSVVQRWASGPGFQAGPTDSPPAVWFEPRPAEAFSFESNLFDKASTYGASRIGWGALKLVNIDGQLDGLLEHAIDGRALRVYLADPERPLSAATLAFRCRMERLRAETDLLSIEVLDRLVDLDKPVCSSRFAGTDSPPGGVGGREDLRDKRRPMIYGAVVNVPPVLVNPSKSIYCLSANPVAVTAVRDKGGELVVDTPATSQADLEALEPVGGHCRIWSSPAGTYLRFGLAPTQPTVDATTADPRCASLIAQLLRDAGVAAADISQADVDTLNALQPAPVGLVATDEQTVLDAANRLAESIGAWLIVDSRDVFRLGRLDAPAAQADLTLTADDHIVAGSLRLISSGNDDRGLPCHTVTLEFDRNWTPQTELIGAIPKDDPRRSWAREAVRKVSVTSESVKARHPLAVELRQTTLLRRRDDAQAEAARRLLLYGVARRTFELEAQLEPAQLAGLQLGQTVRVVHPRFGLAAGRNLRLISLSPDLRAGGVKLRLWG